MLTFYMGAGDKNSGLYAFEANILSNELCPRLSFLFIRNGTEAIFPVFPTSELSPHPQSYLSSLSALEGSTRLPSTPGWKGDLGVLGWGVQLRDSPGLSTSDLLGS